MIHGIHHMDFVVRDLDRAVERYSTIFGRSPGPRERLDSRGVELVRFDLDGVWLILVQPIRSDSPVADFLAEHGEGFFHLGYRVKDVKQEAERLRAAGIRTIQEEPRRGVEGWKLIDLAVEDALGVTCQLVEVEGG